MSKVGGDDIDRLLEDGMVKVKKRRVKRSTSRHRRHRSSRKHHRSKTPKRTPSSERARIRQRKKEEEIERDSRTIFACQIHHKVDERDIFNFFSQCGRVRDVRLIKDSYSGRSKGLCYIEFYKKESVVTALSFNNQCLGGCPINVQVTQSEKNRVAASVQNSSVLDGPMKLYVTNIPKRLYEDDLDLLLSPFGKLDIIKFERKTNPSTKTKDGYILFKKNSEATNVLMHMNGFEILGKKLRFSQSANRLSQGEDKSRPEFDEKILDGQGGLQLSANTKALLMQRLTDRAGEAINTFKDPINMKRSKYLHLKNMFDPTTEEGDDWDKEIEEDVKIECEKFGRVSKIKADKNSQDGSMFIVFEDEDGAMRAAKQLNGRWFAQKQIVSDLLEEEKFNKKCPK